MVHVVKLLDKLQNTFIEGGLIPKGAYNAETNYSVGDSVDYLGSSYVMFNDADAGTIPTNTSYWQVLAEKGDTGEQGIQGIQGETGEGVIAGGTTGQVLAKASNDDFDTIWKTIDPDDLDDTSTTNKFTTVAEKAIWDAKQDALGFTPENVANKKTTLTDSDSDYPTTRAVNTALGSKITWGGDNTASKGLIGTTSNQPIGFITNNTEKMTVLANGNVGIGTTAPNGSLHVSSANFPVAVIERTTSDTDSIYASDRAIRTRYSGLANGAGVARYFGLSDSTGTLQHAGSFGVRWVDSTAKTMLMTFNTANGGADPTGGTERMVIDGTGNVGIGTTSPGYTLDVNGDINLAANKFIRWTGHAFMAATSSDIILGSASDNRNFKFYNGNGANAPLFIGANGGSYAGNVGIGTTSPTYKLQILGTNGILKVQGTSTVATAPLAYFIDSNSNLEIYGASGVINLGPYNDHDLAFVGNAGTEEKMRITNTGNVGIGTTTPGAKLHVSGGNIRLDNTKSVEAINTINNIAPLIYLDNSNYTRIGEFTNINGFYIGSPAYAQIAGLSSKIITFTSSSAERVRIDSAGNVGIGTNNPTQKLQILALTGLPQSSGTYQNGGLRIESTDYATIDFGIRTAGNGAWIQSTNKTDLSINYPLLLNPNGGNVGIGTTSPDTKLQVVGDTKLGDDNTNYASFATDGELTLTGTARVYKCKTIENAALGKGGTSPDEILVGNFEGHSYDINDDSVFTVPLPPDWAAGTDVVIKIRWAINEAYATNNGEVRWQATWLAVPADGSEAISGAGTTDNSGDINIPSTAYYLTETTVETIPGASLSAGDEIGITIKRVALGDGTNPTADPIITCVGIVYISDKLGTAT